MLEFSRAYACTHSQVNRKPDSLRAPVKLSQFGFVADLLAGCRRAARLTGRLAVAQLDDGLALTVVPDDGVDGRTDAVAQRGRARRRAVLFHVALAAQTHVNAPAAETQDLLERRPEVSVEPSVDDRIQKTVAVSQPQEYRINPGGHAVITKWLDEGEDEEGQPAGREGTHDHAQSLGCLALLARPDLAVEVWCAQEWEASASSLSTALLVSLRVVLGKHLLLRLVAGLARGSVVVRPLTQKGDRATNLSEIREEHIVYTPETCQENEIDNALQDRCFSAEQLI